MMHQLEKDFLLYGEYDINSTQSILKILDNLDSRTSSLEGWLEYNSRDWANSMVDTVNGPVLYSHLSQLYIQSLREKYIRLYEALVTELKLLLRSIAILSKGYLPPQLFPPTTLVEISQKAITMIKTKNPDYVFGSTSSPSTPPLLAHRQSVIPPFRYSSLAGTLSYWYV